MSNAMAWFYDIRNPNNTLLKRDGDFPTQDAAKVAARADAKKIKNSRQPGRVPQPLGLNLRVADPSMLFEGSEGLGFLRLCSPQLMGSMRTTPYE
jgi:hypothetical protein